MAWLAVSLTIRIETVFADISHAGYLIQSVSQHVSNEKSDGEINKINIHFLLPPVSYPHPRRKRSIQPALRSLYSAGIEQCHLHLGRHPQM